MQFIYFICATVEDIKFAVFTGVSLGGNKLFISQFNVTVAAGTPDPLPTLVKSLS